MNEIEELLKLDVKDLPPLKPILLDDLYQNTLKNLHLELGTGPVLYLLSPSYSVMTPTPNDAVTDLITQKEGLLNHLKEYIIQNLAMYSVLIDTSSYFIEQNGFLVLARLRERDSEGRRYEIQYYTHSPQELLSHYEDKIYIGRDFIDLFNFKRKYMGVKEYIISLKGQYDRLLERVPVRMKNPQDYKSFFQEIRESINELHTACSSCSPCRRSSISASSPARTSSRSTPNTGRSTTSLSSSTTKWPSLKTCSGSRRRSISSAT
jgi:hypothetical protein